METRPFRSRPGGPVHADYALDALRGPGTPRTYESRERWLREQAAELDLREFGPELPTYSPRLVQEAIYAFCSRSNRLARGDTCAACPSPCETCAAVICPFATKGSDQRGAVQGVRGFDDNAA